MKMGVEFFGLMTMIFVLISFENTSLVSRKYSLKKIKELRLKHVLVDKCQICNTLTAGATFD
jgi:hypothetical protein